MILFFLTSFVPPWSELGQLEKSNFLVEKIILRLGIFFLFCVISWIINRLEMIVIGVAVCLFVLLARKLFNSFYWLLIRFLQTASMTRNGRATLREGKHVGRGKKKSQNILHIVDCVYWLIADIRSSLGLSQNFLN